MSKTISESGLFILPLILAAAYLNMGQSNCGGGNNTLKCRGVPVTHTFDAVDGSTQSGTSGNDVILVLAGPAVISAGAGDDLVCVIGTQDDINVYGGHGNDQIWGGPGSSLLNGGPGEDAIRGEGGDDILDAGNDGAVLDWLDGGLGNDLLYGDAGLDVLIGGEGHDVLWSGDEGTILDGGAGYDIAYLCADDALEEIEQTASMYANERCKRITDVEISPETLYADEIESGIGQSDTPYFAFIKFSSQFGVPGSTSVQFIDQWVGVGVVNDAMREAEFPESTREQLDFGPRFIPNDPETSSESVWIDGILVLAMESDDGSFETVSAGCDPFLANPCEMKLNPGTLSQYASFCPSAPVLSGIGVRYPRYAEIPFERFGQGKWTVRFEF